MILTHVGSTLVRVLVAGMEGIFWPQPRIRLMMGMFITIIVVTKGYVCQP